MLRCDNCEIEFNPHYIAECDDGIGDMGCPECAGSLYEPADEPCDLPVIISRTLRAPPAAIIRFAALGLGAVQ